MNRKRLTLSMILLLSFSFLSLQASDTLDIKLRFFEGTREGRPEPPQVVTSSYLQPTVTANIQSKYDLAEEKRQIKKVFNLKEVSLITEADVSKSMDNSDKILHIFRLDSKEYLVLIKPDSPFWKRQFRIEVYEQGQKDKISLLDTEFILPEKNIAVFGFENRQGKPYFFSFHVAGITGKITAPPPPPPSLKEGKPDFGKGTVRARGEIMPPKLIKKVEPIYPEEAKKARVEGFVIVEATTDKKGNVVNVRILKGKDQFLSQAAMDAVKQWKYEPMYIDGKSYGVIFTTTVNFKLEDKKLDNFTKGAVDAKGEVEKPRLLKKIDPDYPEEARKAGVGGVVILKARIDEKGNVEALRVLKSESTLLNHAAIDAVRQWKYEPYIFDGRPRKVVFTVTVKFVLKDEEEEDFEKGAVKVEGKIKPPRLIKKVEPEYPEEARKARVSGIVILNVKIDEKGSVMQIKILKSPDPLLNKAAVDAVRQWIYEPLIIKGKPRQAVFTVTVRFKLK